MKINFKIFWAVFLICRNHPTFVHHVATIKFEKEKKMTKFKNMVDLLLTLIPQMPTYKLYYMQNITLICNILPKKSPKKHGRASVFFEIDGLVFFLDSIFSWKKINHVKDIQKGPALLLQGKKEHLQWARQRRLTPPQRRRQRAFRAFSLRYGDILGTALQ